MHTTLVYLQIKPEHLPDFIEACRINHEASVREAGNWRFDILQQADDPTCFVLYEAYASSAHAAAHKQTPHYHAWRELVGDWMATPRKGVLYKGLFPEVDPA
jgi:autoinducer 2-degrading protein